MAREDKLVYGHWLSICVDRFLYDSIIFAYALVCLEYLRLAVGIAREGFGSHTDEAPLDRLLPFPVFSVNPIHDAAGFGVYVGSIDTSDDLFVVFHWFAVSFRKFECNFQCGARLSSSSTLSIPHCRMGQVLELTFLGRGLRLEIDEVLVYQVQPVIWPTDITILVHHFVNIDTVSLDSRFNASHGSKKQLWRAPLSNPTALVTKNATKQDKAKRCSCPGAPVLTGSTTSSALDSRSLICVGRPCAGATLILCVSFQS